MQCELSAGGHRFRQFRESLSSNRLFDRAVQLPFANGASVFR